VADLKTIMHIIYLLPGKNAAHFRSTSVDLLVRLMGGDLSLIEEVAAIHTHHAQGLSQGSVSHLCSEQVQQQAPRTNPFALISPTMVGKSFNDFMDKEVCYLLTFTQDGMDYIKFGMTGSVHKRMTEHMRDFPDMQIYTMITVTKAKRLEGAFKTRMKHNGYLVELTVRGVKQTEILSGISAYDAERDLVALFQTKGAEAEVDRELELLREKTKLKKMELMQHMLDLDSGIAPQLLAILRTL
jgi:hypothetical protein